MRLSKEVRWKVARKVADNVVFTQSNSRRNMFQRKF